MEDLTKLLSSNLVNLDSPWTLCGVDNEVLLAIDLIG